MRHGHVTEARRWLAVGLELAADVDPDVRADALWTAARQAAAQSDWPAAESSLQAALPLFRGSERAREVAFTLSELAFIAIRRDELERAGTLCEEALVVARDIGDDRATSAALLTLAEIRSSQGNHVVALDHDEEALALTRSTRGLAPRDRCGSQPRLVAFLAADYARARTAFEESLGLARDLGDTLHTVEALRMLGELDLFEGDPDGAFAKLGESLELCTEVGTTDRERSAASSSRRGAHMESSSSRAARRCRRARSATASTKSTPILRR